MTIEAQAFSQLYNLNFKIIITIKRQMNFNLK